MPAVQVQHLLDYAWFRCCHLNSCCACPYRSIGERLIAGRRVGALKASQAERRRQLEHERSEMKARHSEERNDLALRQREARRPLEEAQEAETRRVGLQRDKGRVTGLVAVLARVSGFDAVRRQLRRYQDRRRHEHFLDELQALDEPQAQARLELQRRHEAQSLDMDRRRRTLAMVETRELKSLGNRASKGAARQGAGPWRRQPDAGTDARTETTRTPGRWLAGQKPALLARGARRDGACPAGSASAAPRRCGKNSRA
jgi:hypothetical protein